MPCCGPTSCNNFDEDRESVSDTDLARFGGDDIRCPECGADVYHDAALCPRCGHAMTAASLKRQSPAWVPIVACLAALGIILWFVQ